MLNLAVVSLMALLEGAADQPKGFNPCLAGGAREAVVFLGTRQKGDKEADPPVISFFGTGFLVSVDGLTYLFTAKHVVKEFLDTRPSGAPFLAAVNLKAGGAVVQSLDDLPKQHGVGWVLDDLVDIAAIPFPTSPDWSTRTIPPEFLVSDEQLTELQDVFFISYQPGLEAKDRVRPIVRRGTIALVSPSEVYMDAFVFPGNSGSPVFIASAPASFSPQGVQTDASAPRTGPFNFGRETWTKRRRTAGRGYCTSCLAEQKC